MTPVSVVLHVGLPKTGTTYLQNVLATCRSELREQGVHYPLPRPGAHFRGAVEVRGSAAKFGLDPGELAGSWRGLCEEARAFDGVTILGHEVLAGATPEEIERALAPLADLDVRIVVSARDLGRQATAHWQEEVKLGHCGSFADFEGDQLRADTGPDAGPDAGGRRPHFWHAQDWADALRRWTAPLTPQAGHLVIAPRPDAPPQELWRRFAEAVGIGPEALTPPDEVSANVSLAGPEIALLRAVNAVIGDRLGRAERLRLVKREWAEGDLALRPGPRPRTPYALRPVLEQATASWISQVTAAGHVVHGDLAELDPVTGDQHDPSPDVSPPTDSDPEVIAAGLLRSARGSGAQAARRGHRLLPRLGRGRR